MSGYSVTEPADQTIEVPLTVGQTVTIYRSATADAYTPIFTDTVDRFNPKTGLIEFEDGDIGRATFMEMVKHADGIHIR